MEWGFDTVICIWFHNPRPMLVTAEHHSEYRLENMEV